MKQVPDTNSRVKRVQGLVFAQFHEFAGAVMFVNNGQLGRKYLSPERLRTAGMILTSLYPFNCLYLSFPAPAQPLVVLAKVAKETNAFCRRKCWNSCGHTQRRHAVYIISGRAAQYVTSKNSSSHANTPENPKILAFSPCSSRFSIDACKW